MQATKLPWQKAKEKNPLFRITQHNTGYQNTTLLESTTERRGDNSVIKIHQWICKILSRKRQKTKPSRKVSVSDFMGLALKLLQRFLHLKVAQTLKAVQGNKQHS